MRFKNKLVFIFLSSLAILLAIFLYPYMLNSAVLDPKGLIALKERDLIYISTLLMLIIVVPVFLLTFAICLKYRVSNKNADYEPEWDYDFLAESIWWGFPCLIILILSIVTWKSTHELDPYKPLESSIKPLKIQVVALQWKWLFIYPDYQIASVNLFQFPEQTPLHFDITADAPMNSFWIPQLGGQIYAMPGMNTKLHLVAHQTGEFRGSSANVSGHGFAGMNFIAKSSTLEEFDNWIKAAQQSSQKLDMNEYYHLALPSEYQPVSLYKLDQDNLYHHILMKYMMPDAPMKKIVRKLVDSTP